MALSKEENDLLVIASEIEKMLKSKGWKHVKAIFDAMFVDIVGGVQKDGSIIGGAIDDKKLLAEHEWYLGYRKALLDFYQRAIVGPILDKNDILERLAEEDNVSKKGKVNKFEHPAEDLPNMS